jgi:cytochrome c
MKYLFAIAPLALLAACGGKTEDAAQTANTEATAPSVASSDGPPEAFAQCAVCHKVAAADGNAVGPNLHGVVGRKAGIVPGYTYSTAMKDWGQTWTDENLDKFLTNPRALLAGTRMSFMGQADPQKRKDIIAWLKKNN